MTSKIAITNIIIKTIKYYKEIKIYPFNYLKRNILYIIVL